MRRSTRVRRLIVAFLVVLALAVAVRFARANGSDAVAGTPDRARSSERSMNRQFDASSAFQHRLGLPR